MPSLVEIGTSTIGKSEALHLNKLDSSLHKDVLCQVCMLVDPVDLEKIFKLPQRIFTISSLCPFGKGRDPFICTNMNFLDRTMLCANLVWRRQKFVKFIDINR